MTETVSALWRQYAYVYGGDGSWLESVGQVGSDIFLAFIYPSVGLSFYLSI